MLSCCHDEYLPGRTNKNSIQDFVRLLHFHSQVIYIACSMINNEKNIESIDKYAERYEDILRKELDTFREGASLLNVSLKLSYEVLKDRKSDDNGLLAVDLLNILACFSGSYILEETFRRAWQSIL